MPQRYEALEFSTGGTIYRTVPPTEKKLHIRQMPAISPF